MAHMSILPNHPPPHLTHKPNILPIVAMPQTILARQKGGATGIVRKRCAHLHKIQLLEECVWLHLERNLSLCGAVRALSISHSFLIKWKATLLTLKAEHGKSRRSINKGYVGQLNPVKEELLARIFAHWEHGYPSDKVPCCVQGLFQAQ